LLADRSRKLPRIDPCRIRRRQRERSRPLWETWFLPGLPGGRVGLYLKVHHVFADGPAAVAMLGALLDTVPEAAPSSGRSWTPAPSTRDLCEDSLRTSTRVLAASSRPVTTARRARAGWRAVREALAEGLAPRTSLSRPIGPDRRLTLVRSRLEMDAPRGKGAGSASFWVLRARGACAGCARPGRDGSPLGTG